MMSERVDRLRDGLKNLSHKKFRVQRVLSVLDHNGIRSQPLVIRKAEAFALLLREMPVAIQDDELIVGLRTMFGAPRSDRRSLFREVDKESGLRFFPLYATDEEEQDCPQGSVSSHTVAGYHRILENGFGSLRREVQERRGRVDGREPDDQDRRDFLSAVLVTFQAASDLMGRYADCARRDALQAGSAERRSELEHIACSLDHLKTGRPRSFQEALQLFWMARIMVMCESYSCMPLGRLDQYLWPFLEHDLREGVLARDDALELLGCVLIKMNEDLDIGTADSCQRLMLSGQTADGRDATNKMTYLVLDAVEELRLLDPKVGVRLHSASPDELVARCAALMAGPMNGFPAIYNDDAIIPLLVERAEIPLVDARNYCNDGCAELQISGESDFYPTWVRLGFLKLLDELLQQERGYDRFEDLMRDYEGQIVREIQNGVSLGNTREQQLARISPVPFLSGTFASCVENGRDKTRGGARFNHTGFLGMELPDAANALMGLKRAVYEEKKLGLDELRGIMATDFRDREDLRLYFRNRVPKYGNDVECVDSLLQRLAGFFADEVLRHPNGRGGRYLPGFFDFGNFVTGARDIGATPDGRHAGEACSVHLSPAPGTDRSGATAALKSFAAACRSRPPLGGIMDVTFHPTAVEGQDGCSKLIGFIRAFLELGCLAEQTNVLDAETLRDAQRNPQKHRDLMVRVWGFSAYFTDLGPEFQEHVIRRTEHRQ